MNLTSISYAKLKWSGEFDSKFTLTFFREVVFYLNKTYESVIAHIDYVDKEDLDLVNHLSGATQKYLKLSFKNIQDFMTVRSELQVIVARNQKDRET